MKRDEQCGNDSRNQNADDYPFSGVVPLRDISPPDNLLLRVGCWDAHHEVFTSLRNRLQSFLMALLALKTKPRRIIFKPGAENSEFEEAASSAGIETVNGCTLVMLGAGTF